MKRRRKTVKGLILWKNHRTDYEDVLLSTIGGLISKLSCIRTDEDGRDYFVPDEDYEIIIRPKL